MAYILSLDQGTTSSRSLIIDETGAVIALAQKEFSQSFPSPGWVEHDAEEIWASQYETALQVVKECAGSPISAIGIANQRETTVIWDRKTSKPIYPAIVWQDRRTTEICQKLKDRGLEPLFRKKTGLVLDPYFSGTKIRWILDHVPGAQEKAERGELAFGTIDSWLVWKLTEGKLHVTDASNASRTLLLNNQTLEWDEELLSLLNIPRSLLAEVKSNAEVYGSTTLFSSPIPIAGMAGDQQAALFGQCCFKPGEAKATYGTGCFLLMNAGSTPPKSERRLLSTVAWKIGAKTTYALEGSVFVAGAAIQWLKENLGLIKKSSEIDELASSVQDTGGVYFVPAFTGLGAPHWDPRARGAIFGLTRGTTKAHIARALLESIAFSAADVLEAMESDANRKVLNIRVDGGVAASDLLMQLQADLNRSPVLRPKNHELTALGAAMFAGLAVGVWKNIDELAALRQEEKVFLPLESVDAMKKRKEFWASAIEQCMGWMR